MGKRETASSNFKEGGLIKGSSNFPWDLGAGDCPMASADYTSHLSLSHTHWTVFFEITFSIWVFHSSPSTYSPAICQVSFLCFSTVVRGSRERRETEIEAKGVGRTLMATDANLTHVYWAKCDKVSSAGFAPCTPFQPSAAPCSSATGCGLVGSSM